MTNINSSCSDFSSFINVLLTEVLQQLYSRFSK